MSALTVPQEYRALMMFDQLPAGCIAVRCEDHFSAPHIRQGEFVVVDTNDRTPRHLETFVIEWHGGRRNICEVLSREFNWTDKSIPRRGWSVRSISGHRGKAVAAFLDEQLADTAGTGGMIELPHTFGWAEGPYRSDDGYLESKLVGCVIGLYEPKGGAS